MPRLRPALSWRRAAAELVFLVTFGALMTVVGPYTTGALPLAIRAIYWQLCIVGGGLIGIVIDETLGRRQPDLWRRIALTSLAMTPLVAVLVMGVGEGLMPSPLRPFFSLQFLGQVFVISLLVMALRALAWRPTRTVVQTRTIVAAPVPQAEAEFRQRLSSRRRAARLIAVEAEDHYLRVHTDAGEELLTMRFADALALLRAAAGFQTHRSWWIAAEAIESVRWSKGVGEARLAGGLTAPVSRTHGPVLKAAGWF